MPLLLPSKRSKAYNYAYREQENENKKENGLNVTNPPNMESMKII